MHQVESVLDIQQQAQVLEADDQESNTQVFVTLTQRGKKREIIPFPGPSPNPNPNCKHKALTIWLRVTADDCGAINRL